MVVMRKIGYVILIFASFVVATYSLSLPFPWWVPIEALCAITIFVGFCKILE